MMETRDFNVPGRIIDFYQGGGAWVAYETGHDASHKDLDADEIALFEAVDNGKEVKPGKGGYYVKAKLSPLAIEALRYWAETLETASQDDAAHDSYARNDLRAARKVLEQLQGWQL